jgi:aspartate/methionine/tyrosine aminotransferase
MEVGQPSTAAPSKARDVLAQTMQHQSLGYSVSLGLPELREGIAKLYKDWYSLDIDPARIIVTSGSSGAFILAFTALFDTGDRVGMGEPGYPSYRQILSALDLCPVGLETSAENRFQPVPGDIAAAGDLAGIIVASPGNPSGTMLDRPALEAIVDCTSARGISLISDEIYHGIQYDRRAVSALEISDDLYVINSFSKYFSMTGWRVGWMIVPPDHVRTIERLAQNLFICAPHASQITALAALDCMDELEANCAVYATNRQLMMEGLPQAGFGKIAPPDGAFYIYADVSDITDDSHALCNAILEQAGVAVTPGIDFDKGRGHQTLRFSYARSTEDIKEGLRRLATFMSARGKGV